MQTRACRPKDALECCVLCVCVGGGGRRTRKIGIFVFECSFHSASVGPLLDRSTGKPAQSVIPLSEISVLLSSRYECSIVLCNCLTFTSTHSVSAPPEVERRILRWVRFQYTEEVANRQVCQFAHVKADLVLSPTCQPQP